MVILSQAFVDVDERMQKRHESIINFFAIAGKHSSSNWEERKCAYISLSALLCIKRVVVHCWDNQLLIKFFNTETTCIYMFFQTIKYEKNRVFPTFTVIDNLELIPSNTAFSWVLSHVNYFEFYLEFTLVNTEFAANYLKSVNHKFISHFLTCYTGIIFTKKIRNYSLLITHVFLKTIPSYLLIITSDITLENSY